MIKLGNRRRRRPEYLLYVKVQTRGRALARLRVTVAVVVALGMVALTCCVAYRLIRSSVDRLVYHNPRFAIQQIVVDDDGVLTPERVMQFAGVQIGQNLLSLDLDQARHNLELLPLVCGVEVRRMLPNRLLIRVNERVAVARLRVPMRELGDSA